MPRYIHVGNHGGGCCGARHIEGMSYNDSNHERRLEEIKLEVQRFQKESRGAGKVIEIIMTDYQIESSPNLTAGLKKLGFRLVSRFNNSSGSWCNVLHHTPHNKLHSSPYWKKG